MLVNKFVVILMVLSFFSCSYQGKKSKSIERSKNPIVKGWYADPEGVVFGDQYWSFPTISAKYEDQVFLDGRWSLHLWFVPLLSWSCRSCWRLFER